MKNTLIACILFATVMHSLARSIISEDEDNGVLTASTGSKSGDHSDFLKITKAPPARVAQPFGSTIELECEAVGSPIPIVEWVHGSGRLSSVSINMIIRLEKVNLINSPFTDNSLTNSKQT